MPQLIVQVQTTLANVQDVEVTDSIQEDLAQHDLLPEDQVVDTGYVDADLLVSSQEKYGIRLLGPALSDNSWQAKADKGFDAAHFQIDWQGRLVTCPQGQTSQRWTPIDKPDRIEVVFARHTCAACPCRTDCTQSQTTGRVLHLRPRAAHQARPRTTARTADAGVSPAVCQASGHRGDALARRARYGVASGTL